MKTIPLPLRTTDVVFLLTNTRNCTRAVSYTHLDVYKRQERAFRNHTHVNKIRIAQFVSHTITSGDADINAKNGTMNTILGLLAKGDMNCAGAEINPDKSLFEENKTTTSSTTDIHQTPRKPTEIGQGVVLTAAEKEKAEAERRSCLLYTSRCV